MSGLLIIEGFIENHYPKLASAKRRTLALKDLELPGSDDDTPKISAPIPYFDLALDGHKLWVLALDGNALPSRAKPTTSSCRPHRERRSPSRSAQRGAMRSAPARSKPGKPATPTQMSCLPHSRSRASPSTTPIFVPSSTRQ